MTSVLEKNFGRSTAYSCRTNVFILFHRFKKKTIATAEDWATEARHFKLMGMYGFF